MEYRGKTQLLGFFPKAAIHAKTALFLNRNPLKWLPFLDTQSPLVYFFRHLPEEQRVFVIRKVFLYPA
jgi:hypothetical protein